MTSDLEAIRAAHARWFTASATMDTPLMRTAFVKGDGLEMFNLNGFNYQGVDELARLWSYYFADQDWDECRDLAEPEIHIDGDLATLTCTKIVMTVLERTEDSTRQFDYFRGTEIYRRDDGEGNREWRIWHTHYSFVADDSEPRPGIDLEP